jgi:hypothetical protein
MRGLLIAAVLLAGCDGVPDAPVGEAPLVEPARVEAEKACSAITGYRPGSSDKLHAQEYADCVAAVATEDAVVPDEATGPVLRGRTDAPA